VGGLFALFFVFIYRQAFNGFFKKQFNTLIGFILMRKYMPDNIEIEKSRPKLCYGLPIAIGTGTYIILKTMEYNIFC
jgi:prepilin peptidase CpaA